MRRGFWYPECARTYWIFGNECTALATREALTNGCGARICSSHRHLIFRLFD